jgi:hypothetical protein
MLDRMSRYPLEWGWEPQATETSATSDSPRETFLGRKPRQEDDVHDVAWGDRLCARHPRKEGKTGAYEVTREILCRDCAVKKLGFENLPSDQQTAYMRPYCLDPK